jgi:hypothetical protein
MVGQANNIIKYKDMKLEQEFKDLLDDKIWAEVRSNLNWDSDVCHNNSITIEWGGLTYDIYFSAWVDTYWNDRPDSSREIRYMDIDNVICYVADFVNDIDDEFEEEQGLVIDYMSGLQLYE